MTGEKFTPSRGPGLAEVLESVFFARHSRSAAVEQARSGDGRERWGVADPPMASLLNARSPISGCQSGESHVWLKGGDFGLTAKQ